MLLPLACSDEEPPPPPLRPVRTQEVVATGSSRVRTFSGATRAGIETRLSFRVPGQIRRLPVRVGDRVAAGTLLAELERTDYTLAVEQRRASLAQAGAAERKASADYERVRQLYENQNASRNDLDAARAAFESATAQVEAATKQLEMAERQLDYTELRAPVDCDVAAVLVEVNENVQAGQGVVILTAGDALEVEVAMPEILIAQVAEGDPVEVVIDAMPGERFAATVTEVGVQPTGSATTFPVKVRLETAVDAIRPGMAAEVAFRFEASGGGETIYVPAVAVGEDRAGRFVFVAEPETGGDDAAGTAGATIGATTAAATTAVVHRRAVTVGNLTADGIEIEDGLEEGDLVVTAGVSKIQDGMRVKLMPGARP
jgi:RND family efflux transporter MFP subunit